MIKLILKEDKASISGNQQFIKKNVIAMLRKVGISKMKADTLQVPEGEITLSFDANPEQKEQLKQLLLKKVGKKGSSKRAKLHFIDTLKEMIREELNESVLYEAKYKQTYKSITARDKDSRRIWGSQIGHPRVSVRSWSEVGKTGRMKTAYIEIEGDKDWVDAYKKIAFSGKGNFTDVVKSLKESVNESREEMKSLNEAKKISKKEYTQMAKDFVGEWKQTIINKYRNDGYADLESMVVDTANALRYDPEYKNVDADWLYDAIDKELNKQSWFKKISKHSIK